MTIKQLQQLIATHTSLMQRAKRMLDERYQELEDRGEEMAWIAEFVKHKKIVEWAEKETPNDE